MLYVIIITANYCNFLQFSPRSCSFPFSSKINKFFFNKLNIKGSFLSFPLISVNKIKIVNEQTKHKGVFPFISVNFQIIPFIKRLLPKYKYCLILPIPD